MKKDWRNFMPTLKISSAALMKKSKTACVFIYRSSNAHK
jgi:hypothetical protein